MTILRTTAIAFSSLLLCSIPAAAQLLEAFPGDGAELAEALSGADVVHVGFVNEKAIRTSEDRFSLFDAIEEAVLTGAKRDVIRVQIELFQGGSPWRSMSGDGDRHAQALIDHGTGSRHLVSNAAGSEQKKSKRYLSPSDLPADVKLRQAVPRTVARLRRVIAPDSAAVVEGLFCQNDRAEWPAFAGCAFEEALAGLSAPDGRPLRVVRIDIVPNSVLLQSESRELPVDASPGPVAFARRAYDRLYDASHRLSGKAPDSAAPYVVSTDRLKDERLGQKPLTDLADYVIFVPAAAKPAVAKTPRASMLRAVTIAPETATGEEPDSSRQPPAAGVTGRRGDSRDNTDAEQCVNGMREARTTIDERILENCACSKVFHGGGARFRVSYQCGNTCVHDRDRNGTWELRPGSCGSFL